MGPTLLEGPRTEAQRKLIIADINETDDTKLQHSQEIIEAWIHSQPHLPQNYDPRLLPLFIRGCKHNLDSVKRKLDAFFSIRNSQPEFFLDRDPHEKNVQNILNSTIIAPLPAQSPDGCRIIYHKLPRDFDVVSLVRTILMIGDIRLIEEPLVRGDIFVWDFGELQFKHLSQLAIPATKKALVAAQEAYPQRLQQIHLINCSSVAEKIVNFFKMFMKPKMKNRWFLHSNHTTLSKHFPEECIPKEYGGTADSIHDIHESWKQKLYEYTDWFEQQANVTTDESKRPTNDKESRYRNSEVEQIKGTFRQIQID